MADDLSMLSNRVRSENLRKIKPLGLFERQRLERDEGRKIVVLPLSLQAAVAARNHQIEVESKKIRERITRGQIAMKNRLTDLNDHLFRQMERLNDESLKGPALQEEVIRSKAISGISRDIVANAKTVLDAQQFVSGLDPAKNQVPEMLQDKPKQITVG